MKKYLNVVLTLFDANTNVTTDNTPGNDLSDEMKTSPMSSLMYNELLNIYSEAPMKEKQEIYKTLQNLYPTYTNKLSRIKEAYKE